MIQLFVEQVSDVLVSDVVPFDDFAFIFLDPNKKTIAREITSEEFGGVVASGAPGLVPIGLSDKSFVRLELFFQQREAREILFAPSHVPSPEFPKCIGAILRVFESGFSLTGGPHLSVARRVGAHAYIDQEV